VDTLFSLNHVGVQVVAMLATFVLCLTLGAERHLRHKDAGVKTHVLVGLGSCLFTLVSAYGFAPITGSDGAVGPSRRAAERRLAGTPWRLNAEVPGSYLRGPDGGLSAPLSRRLMTALERGDLSLRGVDRVLRLAWTLADLEGDDALSLTHIGTALVLRTSGVRP